MSNVEETNNDNMMGISGVGSSDVSGGSSNSESCSMGLEHRFGIREPMDRRGYGVLDPGFQDAERPIDGPSDDRSSNDRASGYGRVLHPANPIFAMQSSYHEYAPEHMPEQDAYSYSDMTQADPVVDLFEEADDRLHPAHAFDPEWIDFNADADAAFVPTNNLPHSGFVPVDAKSASFAAIKKPIVDSERKNNVLLTVVFYVAVALYAAWMIFAASYDNDIWFILATGEEIVNNGFPHINPFAIHDDMGIVIQQWIPCVISYFIYNAGGFVGLGIWTLILFTLMAFSFYKVSRIIRGDSYGSEMIALVFLPLVFVLSAYTSVRPHLYTMIAFIWIIGLLTLYRRTSKMVYIAVLVPIVAMHANFQISMAPFDIVIMVCYLIPDILKPLHNRGRLLPINCVQWDYKRLPLLIVTLLSVAALLLNPYFIDGAMYLVNSFGAASYRNYISEMNPLVPANNWVYVVGVVFFIVSAIALGAQGLKKIDFPLLLLMVGTVVLSFMQIRNIWLGPLFCSLYLVSVGAHHSLFIIAKLKAKLKVRKVLSWAIGCLGALASCLLIASGVPSLQALPYNTADTPVAAVDYLDEIGADKSKTRVLNFFNSGGYFEYRGYKVVMDPRPELWSPSVTGLSFDYYREFVDMTLGDTYIDDFIDKYDLNVYVVDKTDPSVDIFKNQELYLEISGGDDYRAFIKKDAYEYLTGKDVSTAPKAVRHVSKKSSS